MIPAALAAILTPLLGNGLNLVANAVMAKGKDFVEKKLGVELKPDMSPEDLVKIQIAQMEHEEELLDKIYDLQMRVKLLEQREKN